MERKISFSIPHDEGDGQAVLARLNDIIELLNMEKDEQALEPSFFKGNISDYPAWFTQAFEDQARLAILEKLCGYEAGDLDDWELESWYDDIFEVPTHTFAIQQNQEASGSHTLTFTVDQEGYVEGNIHLWLLVAAGAQTGTPR